MRILSFLLLLTLSYVSSATIESTGRICVQGGPVPSECPNNYQWNSVTCKFECKPHCVSNEGVFIFPASNGTNFRRKCNACTCQSQASTTNAICTLMACPTNVCYDDTGVRYPIGSIMTSHCRTGTCSLVNGEAVWSWYSPASASIKPNCPYAPGVFNNATCKWECPSTCQDGSTPRKCTGGLPPCSVVRCGSNPECTNNYCPNYPNDNRGACTATCVTPALCTKDPCQTTPGKPKCGKNQVCQADYRFGCGYQCQDITCVNNDQIYQVGETRPSQDGCNTCTCRENGDWICTERACVNPSDRPICIQGGPVPPQCPNNNRWNSVTCQFECVCPQKQNCGINGVWDYDTCRCVVNTPAPSDRPICVQGGPVPSQCPNNNRWNSVTCQFECVCPQNQNCGINGVWDYDTCRCVVNSPSPSTERPICVEGGPVPTQCPNNNRWNSVTCQFECVCYQNQSCGINGVWNYDTCRCVVNTPSPPTCTPPQAPGCDFAPAVLDQTSCKYFCPSTCSDGSSPVNCLINPCASTSCLTNTECKANYCGGCNAVCKPIEPIVQCFVQPCTVNSCANGQTCVNDYNGGCNYRCV